MAGGRWSGPIATAMGVSAGAGAAQLGLAYGLGIISWQGAASADSWATNITWTAWIAAVSVVLGAVVADRLCRHTAAHEQRTEPGVVTSLLEPDPPAREFTQAAAFWRFVLVTAAA